MQQDKIDDIMDNFDFSKVETVMKATNWTWASTNGVPAEHELRKQARELLKSVCRHYVSELGFRYAISTGGFKATKYYERAASLLNFDTMVSFWFYLLYGNDGRCERIQISHIVDFLWTNDLVFIHTCQYI